jgi:hypothetical protein
MNIGPVTLEAQYSPTEVIAAAADLVAPVAIGHHR